MPKTSREPVERAVRALEAEANRLDGLLGYLLFNATMSFTEQRLRPLLLAEGQATEPAVAPRSGDGADQLMDFWIRIVLSQGLTGAANRLRRHAKALRKLAAKPPT